MTFTIETDKCMIRRSPDGTERVLLSFKDTSLPLPPGAKEKVMFFGLPPIEGINEAFIREHVPDLEIEVEEVEDEEPAPVNESD